MYTLEGVYVHHLIAGVPRGREKMVGNLELYCREAPGTESGFSVNAVSMLRHLSSPSTGFSNK